MIEIDWLRGNCPVQAKGRIDGEPFYFRARGEHWSLDIGGADPVDEGDWWTQEEWPGGPYAAGWMSYDDARACIERGAAAWRAAKAATPPVPQAEEEKG